jgi:hypothetical protein
MRPEAFHQRSTVTRRGINFGIFSARMLYLHQSAQMFYGITARTAAEGALS